MTNYRSCRQGKRLVHLLSIWTLLAWWVRESLLQKISPHQHPHPHHSVTIHIHTARHRRSAFVDCHSRLRRWHAFPSWELTVNVLILCTEKIL